MAETYNANYPSFHIMICLIQIWELKDKTQDLMKIPSDAIRLTEVESIEVSESYKQLIGTASVKFPRGTIIRKTVTQANEKEVANDASLKVNLDDAGVLQEVRSGSYVASSGTFKTGMRIRINLGYTTDPLVASWGKVEKGKKNIFNDSDLLAQYEEACSFQAFDGYITKVSVDTPIELRCENLASGLKDVSCPNVTLKGNNTVNTMLDNDGKYHLLKGTGLSLLPASAAQKYDIGAITLDDELSVADVLTEWSKFGLLAFVTYDNDNNPCIAIGRQYFSDADKDSIINTVSQPSTPTTILFNYHVANNGLNLTMTEKKYMAVSAEGVDKDYKMIRLTIAYDPKYNPEDSSTAKSKYRVISETALTKKQIKDGVKPLKHTQDKIDMNLYNKIPYHSRKIPITKDQLYEEAVKYLEAYNPNGIEGSLTLFGDLGLHTATKIRLQDDRYPGKNGDYIVDEVTTTYGPQGYRQTIRIPYCINRKAQSSS